MLTKIISRKVYVFKKIVQVDILNMYWSKIGLNSDKIIFHWCFPTFFCNFEEYEKNQLQNI